MMTEFTTVHSVEQILTFLYALIFGGILCFLYDGLRGFRKVFRPRSVAFFCQDVLFFAVSAVLVFCFLLVRCDGQLRIYALMSMAGGFSIFRVALSRWLVLAFASVFRFMTKTAEAIRPPIRLLFKKIRDFSASTWMKFKNILKRKKKPLEKQVEVDV